MFHDLLDNSSEFNSSIHNYFDSDQSSFSCYQSTYLNLSHNPFKINKEEGATGETDIKTNNNKKKEEKNLDKKQKEKKMRKKNIINIHMIIH